MANELPAKIAFRAEHTDSAPKDRAQRLAQQVATAHEQTKNIVAALMNRVYVALATNVAITSVAAYAVLISTTITTVFDAGYIDIYFTVSGINSTAISNQRFVIIVDGVTVKGVYAYAAAGQTFSGAIVVRVAVTAGLHTITASWRTDAGNARVNAATVPEEHAHLIVQESP